MTSNSIILALIGISLTFLPNEISNYIRQSSVDYLPIILQLLGATYFAFAMLNWMSKDNVFGGIYSRPIIIGNLTHYLVGGLALSKETFVNQNIVILWIGSIYYLIFALLFGLLLFQNPVKIDIAE